MKPTTSGLGQLARQRALWRYRIRAPLAKRRTLTEIIGGQQFEVDPGVFNPVLHLSGAAIAPLIAAPLVAPTDRVLDLGTGCGLLAVKSAAVAREVVAADISETAVTCARRNVTRLGVAERVEVVHSDLFDNVGPARFDLILANPPYEIDAPDDVADAAFASADFFDRLASELADHVANAGRMLMALPAPVTEPLGILRSHGHRCVIEATVPTPFVSLNLWAVSCARPR